MASYINTTSTNSTFILQQYLAHKVCDASTTYCLGEDQQFESHDECMGYMTAKKVGEWYRMGGERSLSTYLGDPTDDMLERRG
jgi:hypothetical protein